MTVQKAVGPALAPTVAPTVELTAEEIAKTLSPEVIEAYQQGKDVKLMFDKSQLRHVGTREAMTRLYESGVPVKCGKAPLVQRNYAVGTYETVREDSSAPQTLQCIRVEKPLHPIAPSN